MVSERNYDVIAVGELNPDLIVSGLVNLPRLGKEILATELNLRLGSSTAIAAAQMSKLGLNVAMVTKVGKDYYGEFCQNELSLAGVETRYVIESEDVRTGITISLTYPQDRCLVTYLGSISELRADDLADEILLQGKHIHISSYYLQHSLQSDCVSLLKRAKKMGLSTSLDPGDDPKSTWASGIRDVLKHVDIFFPNSNELQGIMGTDDIEQAVQRLGNDVNIIAAKLGGRGSILFHKGKIEHFAPHKVTVVDTTGAGDSFNAGFMYGWINGYEPTTSMILANACGALSTTHVGGVSGFTSFEDVERFIQSSQTLEV